MAMTKDFKPVKRLHAINPIPRIMKLLVISNLYPPHGIGGYEERCLNTVEELRARGHDVHVLTSDHQVGGRDASGEHQVHRRLKVHGFYGHPWLPIRTLYRQEKVNQQVLREVLELVKPELVHVWNMGGISKALLHSLERESTPLVYDISDHWIARSLRADVWLSWWNDLGSMARVCMRGLLSASGVRRRIDQIVPTAPVSELRFENIYFCSEFMRDLTANKGYPVQHADVVYCGVEAADFARKREYRKPLKYIWVGRLAEDKDPLTAIRGFIRAREGLGMAMELHVYGKGEDAYAQQLKSEVHKAHAEDYVQFKSASHEAMRSLYAEYDAYIFSSNWGEPFALTPLEAMASGLPVIMCPDGGDAELIEDGYNALQFTAGSPSSLVGAINRMVELSDYGERMSANALRIVEEQFTIEKMTDHIETILKRSVKT